MISITNQDVITVSTEAASDTDEIPGTSWLCWQKMHVLCWHASGIMSSCWLCWQRMHLLCWHASGIMSICWLCEQRGHLNQAISRHGQDAGRHGRSSLCSRGHSGSFQTETAYQHQRWEIAYRLVDGVMYTQSEVPELNLYTGIAIVFQVCAVSACCKIIHCILW